MDRAINELQYEAWKIAEDKGFHAGYSGRGRNDTLLRLCLVHTEVSEAAQEVKRNWKESGTPEQVKVFTEELADVVIRILDLAGCVGCELQDAVEQKMEKNRNRPYLYNTAKEDPSK